MSKDLIAEDFEGGENLSELAGVVGGGLNRRFYVVTVIEGGVCNSFFRVRDRGKTHKENKDRDFTNLQQAVDYYNRKEAV